ncbi:ferritin family protein [Brevibacillus daliensis]|uniref:ferritin family protein n=1 Tax=Brevibacillus daliensis TaxID=2892995 RepID=UPI001E41747F|nr:ferritin family protein [Brevibacillus daliensis]
MQTNVGSINDMLQQQPPIPTPPQVITTKDLSYLKDAMSWELDAFKKFHFYAEHAKNPETKQLLNQVGSMHQKHYNTLLHHLTNDNNSVMATIPAPPKQQ